MSEPSSARHHLPYLASGQAQKELTHNEALALIDAGLHPAAKGIGIETPPAAPESGECWILGMAPVGAWLGQAEALASWTGHGWRFLAPREGMRVWLTDQQIWAERRPGAWAVGDVRGTRLVIDGEPSVGPKAASVASPSGGTVVDIEARTAIDSLIARLVSHGLIAG